MKTDKSEDAFLAAICDHPEDRSGRLIYADWLEERADSRAELIRIEEEMRTLPTYSDRYWQLKPRRNLLRTQSDSPWLESMAYGTDYEPMFGDVPVGCKERWRFIREFVERWHKVALPDLGTQQNRIRGVEKQLGYQLPYSIREWIAFLWDLIDAKGYDHVFRDCLSFTELEEYPALSLMIQGESDYHWAVNKEHLQLEDPPVDGYYLDYRAEGNRFVHDRVWAPHVSTWVLIHIGMYVSIASQGGGIGSHVSNASELKQQLLEAFPVTTALGDDDLFEAPNMMVKLSTRSGTGYLNVDLWKKLPPQQMPACLRQFIARR
jgi:uncharacterized protein (TIGR02996 family)